VFKCQVSLKGFLKIVEEGNPSKRGLYNYIKKLRKEENQELSKKLLRKKNYMMHLQVKKNWATSFTM